MANQRVFVSFSGLDKDRFVNKLFARLQAQPFDLWDYSAEGREIPGGNPIYDYLQDKIDSCDLFIPVVSCNSFASAFTCREMAHALDRFQYGKLRIIPLVATEVIGKNWPSPYDALGAEGLCIRYYELDFAARLSLENVLMRVCADMGVSFVPLIVEDPRLPFMDRFENELRDTQPSDAEGPSAERMIVTYRRLWSILNDFILAFQDGDYFKALAKINFFIATAEYDYSQHRFYFPYIVKSVCEMSCGRLVNALETLRSLDDLESKDENYYGALGFIKQQQGFHREAASMYREALKRDPDDPAAMAGILLNELLGGIPTDVDAALKVIDSGVIAVHADRMKALELKAFALAMAGRPGEAYAVYRQMVKNGHVTGNMVVNFAFVMKDIGLVSEAVGMLEDYCRKNPGDAVPLHTLASLCSALGDARRSRLYFADLVGKNPTNRQYVIDAAQVYYASGDIAKSKELANSLLAVGRTNLPTSSNDFFYDGFAQWFLGEFSRARYDFERSSMPEEAYYDKTMRAFGGG